MRMSLKTVTVGASMKYHELATRMPYTRLLGPQPTSNECCRSGVGRCATWVVDVIGSWLSILQRWAQSFRELSHPC